VLHGLTGAERTLNLPLPQRRGADDDVDYQVAAADGPAGRSLILHRRQAGIHRAATGVGASVEDMADVWVVIGIVGFVAAMLGLIRGLERL
jgi:hypothetical protein